MSVDCVPLIRHRNVIYKVKNHPLWRYEMSPAPLIAIIGPSGCGKTTVADALAKKLQWPMIEADDYHSDHNRSKMARSIPLNDADRYPWLMTIYKKLSEIDNAVVACSALKRKYRDILVQGDLTNSNRKNDILFVLLQADEELLRQRLSRREGHFMPETLITSQLQTLELFHPDENCLTVDAAQTCERIVDIIIEKINQTN